MDETVSGQRLISPLVASIHFFFAIESQLNWRTNPARVPSHKRGRKESTLIEEASLIPVASSFFCASAKTIAKEGGPLLEEMRGSVPREIEFTERRRFKRVPVLRPVKYISEQFGITSSLILDLSCGGAFIESPVVPGDCEIEMKFNLIDGYTVRATALVRYVILGAGMGVEFKSISEEDKAEIGRFVGGFRVPVTARVADDLK